MMLILTLSALTDRLRSSQYQGLHISSPSQLTPAPATPPHHHPLSLHLTLQRYVRNRCSLEKSLTSLQPGCP